MRKALETRGLSVAEAADHFGVSRTTVSNWLHDRTSPSPTERREWATWTDVPADWLETGKAGAPDGGPGLHLLPQVDSNHQHFDYQFGSGAVEGSSFTLAA